MRAAVPLSTLRVWERRHRFPFREAEVTRGELLILATVHLRALRWWDQWVANRVPRDGPPSHAHYYALFDAAGFAHDDGLLGIADDMPSFVAS